MTHSVYISDPDGHGIEVLYERRGDLGGTTSTQPRTR